MRILKASAIFLLVSHFVSPTFAVPSAAQLKLEARYEALLKAENLTKWMTVHAAAA